MARRDPILTDLATTQALGKMPCSFCFQFWKICFDVHINGFQRRVKLIQMSVLWEDLLIAKVKRGVIKSFADRRLSQIVLVG